jgi:hypothetical protein
MAMSSVDVLYYEAEGYRVVSAQRLFGRSAELQSGVADTKGGYSEVGAEEFFGHSSQLVVGVEPNNVGVSLRTTPLYHSLVAVTLVAYLVMLLRSWNFIGSVWSGVLSNRSEQRMAMDGGELPLEQFKYRAATLGFLLFALITVRVADIFAEGSIPKEGEWLVDYVTLVGMLFSVVVAAWFYAFHKVVGWLSQSDSLSQLSAIAYINFVRMVVLLYPLVAVWLVADFGEGFVVSIMLYVVTLLLIVLYIKDTFVLFLQKNISIFYWILYLCTAILLPFSFVVRLLSDKLA